jgi:hypothetical protein
MTTASMVGRIALLAAVRSPTPAPWMLDEPITEARSRQSGSRPAVVPGTAPPSGLRTSPAIAAPGDTLADMTAARVIRPSGNAEVAPGKPPFMSARVVCVAWWGLFAVQVLRVAVT